MCQRHTFRGIRNQIAGHKRILHADMSHGNPIADRDRREHHGHATDIVAVTDCDQEYLLLYLYGLGEDRVTRNIEEADIVLLDKALLGLPYGYRGAPEEWKFYLTQEEVESKQSYIAQSCPPGRL